MNLNIIIFIHSLVMCQFTIICVYLCVGKWIVVVYASFHRTFLLRFPFKGSWKGYYMRCIHSPCNLQIKLDMIKKGRCDLKCNLQNHSITSNANDLFCTVCCSTDSDWHRSKIVATPCNGVKFNLLWSYVTTSQTKDL